VSTRGSARLNFFSGTGAKRSNYGFRQGNGDFWPLAAACSLASQVERPPRWLRFSVAR